MGRLPPWPPLLFPASAVSGRFLQSQIHGFHGRGTIVSSLGSSSVVSLSSVSVPAVTVHAASVGIEPAAFLAVSVTEPAISLGTVLALLAGTVLVASAAVEVSVPVCSAALLASLGIISAVFLSLSVRSVAKPAAAFGTVLALLAAILISLCLAALRSPCLGALRFHLSSSAALLISASGSFSSGSGLRTSLSLGRTLSLLGTAEILALLGHGILRTEYLNQI